MSMSEDEDMCTFEAETTEIVDKFAISQNFSAKKKYEGKKTFEIFFRRNCSPESLGVDC